ncbi:MAG: prolipoprotein diacylglyceryl transferase, partial [Gammaproteobacteria bacterium]|nr:prolipoprotein diacylglyceryl transferase [Gammaproteobacteria bacterium]
MLTYPDINPVALAVGSFEIHWYGLMYLIAFGAGWWLGLVRTRRVGTEWRAAEISDLVFYFALGAVLGGRIGYTLLYNFGAFVDDPLLIFRIWEGGMSYHGGMIGVFIAMGLYGR